MPPRQWDAFRSLNIMNRDSDGMTCVGMNKYGKRCRWDISGTSYDRIRALLDAMERRPPNESIQSLRELAGLSLCQDYHQDQASKMVSQWRTAIIEAAVEYENVQELKRRIRSLEESLATEEVKTEELQRKVAELQDQVGSQPELEELQPELERLRVLLQMNRYENLKGQAEGYRQDSLESERKVWKLEEENAELARQLSVGKEALESATKQSEEKMASSSWLSNQLSIQSAEYQQILLQKDQTIETIAAERDDLRKLVPTLESQFNQSQERNAQIRVEVERATTEQISLSHKVENLTRELDVESKRSSELQSEIFDTRTYRDTLSREADDLRLHLDIERKKSSKVALQLEKAEAANTSLNELITSVHSQLKREHEKCDELTADMNQMKAHQDALSVEGNSFQSELVSAHKASEQLHQDLCTTKEALANAEAALDDVQNRLERCQRSYDELKVTAAAREEEISDLVTELKGKINFVRSRPFKTFFMNMIDIFKGWMNGVFRHIGKVGFLNRQLDANNGDSAA